MVHKVLVIDDEAVLVETIACDISPRLKPGASSSHGEAFLLHRRLRERFEATPVFHRLHRHVLSLSPRVDAKPESRLTESIFSHKEAKMETVALPISPRKDSLLSPCLKAGVLHSKG
jgi:hypothetical protein